LQPNSGADDADGGWASGGETSGGLKLRMADLSSIPAPGFFFCYQGRQGLDNLTVAKASDATVTVSLR
jgi:hypothetical protein